jgi:hypothetical protein
MKVLHLATGRKYYVWAVCDDEGSCQVLETLKAVNMEHPDLVGSILALLYEVVPHEGPPFHDPRRAKWLYRDLLAELKADKDVTRREHAGLRLVFFIDEFHGGPVIVCTNAFSKSGGSTPEECLDFALRERARYFEEKSELEVLWQGASL